MSAAGKPKVIALVGPTASGKTSLSLKLAQVLGGEIIACDSRTVYREFDIGTAKPSAEDRALVKHYAIDVVGPTDDYSAATFAEQSAESIKQILTAGKMPMVVGGTGFYARALLEGLSIPKVEAQPELRQKLKLLESQQGKGSLHQKLLLVDPESAARLNPNDTFRIIRALEVFQMTGQKMSQLAGKQESPFDTLWIGLTVNNREVLHSAIKQRFFEQMEAGMMEETERLYNKYGPHQKMMHTVNYKQLVELLQGKLSREDAHKEAIQHNTQLARRQLIWFRANKSITWFASDECSQVELVERVRAHIKNTSI